MTWYTGNSFWWHFNEEHGISVGNLIGGDTYLPLTQSTPPAWIALGVPSGDFYVNFGTSFTIDYLHNSKIQFKKKKCYLFQTHVKNFEGRHSGWPNSTTPSPPFSYPPPFDFFFEDLTYHKIVSPNNFLRVVIGRSSRGSINYWQGDVSIIDYVYSPYNIYPEGATHSTPIPHTKSFSDFSTVQVLQFFSKPSSDFESPISPVDNKYSLINFNAPSWFGSYTNTNYPNDSTFIKKVEIDEIDFEVQGWAVHKELNYSLNLADYDPRAIGWVYHSGTYSWRISSTNSTGISHAMGPVFGSPIQESFKTSGYPDSGICVASERFTINNWIAKEIEPDQLFNISFDMIFSTQSGICPIYMYIDDNLPKNYTINPKRGLLIATFTQSNSYNFYNLNGGKYLYFVGGSGLTQQNTNVRVDIGNFSIISKYSELDNNKLFSFTSNSIYSEPTPLSIIGSQIESIYETISTTPKTIHNSNSGPIGSKKLSLPKSTNVAIASNITNSSSGNSLGAITSDNGAPSGIQQALKTYGFFSNVIGTVSNLAQINSKVGNGSFNAGVWENGVWNSGWRVDKQSYEFNDITISFNLRTENFKWRVQIEGSAYSASKFEIGDRVSIGNIVAITINEQRKLLKNYFTIVDKNETTIIVEVDNLFPIRRIEKDSENHKILVTKNVWLNGAFLNGYFQGVWNNGLFKGFPFITEMYNTHWIDGTFDGGHFYANKPSFIFQDTYYWDGFVGLTGATAHSLLAGDLITVDKFDKSINPSYDGDYTVTDVIDDYLIITDIPWGDNSANESAKVTRRTSTGVIQNFTFYDNNSSTFTSKNSRNLTDIWRYGSWIDVNFSDESTTNINSTRIYNNKSTTNFIQWRDRHRFGIGDSGVLNLYGNITQDVLSSDSYFRGLDSSIRRIYKLGTKFQIYEDFLGDVSNFDRPFNSDPEEGTLDNFYEEGWTFSFSGIAGGPFTYLNTFKKKSTTLQNISSSSQSPTWVDITFNSSIENTYGSLISESGNTTFEILTAGNYDLSINMPTTRFETSVDTNGLEGGNLGNDYLYLTGNIVVGRIRIVRERNNQQQIILEKVIKTSGSDFINVGTAVYPEGQDSAGFYIKFFNIEIDWKGELIPNDKIKIQFQRCDTRITNYNAAGPWRGSGFEQGVGLNDNITSCIANWVLQTERTLTISNSGVGNSPGYNIKRTTDGTLLVEHTEESWHSITLNNNLIDMPRNRYSVIEFDLIQSPDSQYQPFGESYSFHFTDLYNFTTFLNPDLSYSNQQAFPSSPVKNQTTVGTGSSTITENPISKTALWSGIDYNKTKNTRKIEYFFNRPKLNLGLLAEQGGIFRDQIHELDNIKFYEVDMIPFFQYTTKDYVDRSIKIPYQGNSPNIDIKNQNIKFVDSIDSGFDSYNIQQTNLTYVDLSKNPLIFTTPIFSGFPTLKVLIQTAEQQLAQLAEMQGLSF